MHFWHGKICVLCSYPCEWSLHSVPILLSIVSQQTSSALRPRYEMHISLSLHNVGSGEANINVHVYVRWYNCVYVSESLSAQCTPVTSSASMLTLFQVSYALSILFLLLACVWTCNGIYLQYPCKRGARNHTMLNTTAYLLGTRVHNSHCTANFLYIYTFFDVWA